MHQHYTLAEEIRNTAAAGSQREAGMTQAFQETLATVQQQHTAAQEALTAAHTNAATAFEEIGASLEKAVKERKPGEVELRNLSKLLKHSVQEHGKKRRVAGQSSGTESGSGLEQSTRRWSGSWTSWSET